MANVSLQTVQMADPSLPHELCLPSFSLKLLQVAAHFPPFLLSEVWGHVHPHKSSWWLSVGWAQCPRVLEWEWSGTPTGNSPEAWAPCRACRPPWNTKKSVNTCSNLQFADTHKGEGDVNLSQLPFLGFRQFVKMRSTHIDMTCWAGQWCLAGSWMRQECT